MKDIPIADYPTPRTWCMKAQAAPNIPRGSMGMTGALRIILEDVASGKPQTSPVGIPGSDSEVTLGVCCQRLRPVGLVRDKMVAGPSLRRLRNGFRRRMTAT